MSYRDDLLDEALQEAYRKGEISYRWGKLVDGGIRICDCGEVTLEDERHLCPIKGTEVND